MQSFPAEFAELTDVSQSTAKYFTELVMCNSLVILLIQTNNLEQLVGAFYFCKQFQPPTAPLSIHFLTTLQTKMYCIGLIDKEGKKEDILDISSDITHIKLDKVIHNFIDLKVRLDQVERPTGKIDIFNVYHRKTFVHLSHLYICMYYFNMIL